MKKYVSIIFLCTIAYMPVFSQIHKTEMWTELAANTDIAPKLNAEFVTEIRLQDYGYLLKSISGEISLTYKASKNSRFGITYKATEKYRTEGFFVAHTLSTAYSYRYKIGNVRIAYRNKFEASREMFTNDYTDLWIAYEDRNRVKLSYSRKKAFISPSITIESFHPISYQNVYSISEMRYGAGIDFNLKKKFELSTGYVYKVVYNKSIPQPTSIISVALSKSF